MKRALKRNNDSKRKTFMRNKRKEQIWNIIARRIGCGFSYRWGSRVDGGTDHQRPGIRDYRRHRYRYCRSDAWRMDGQSDWTICKQFGRHFFVGTGRCRSFSEPDAHGKAVGRVEEVGYFKKSWQIVSARKIKKRKVCNEQKLFKSTYRNNSCYLVVFGHSGGGFGNGWAH